MDVKSGPREQMLSELADLVEGRTTGHPLRVGIDGPPAAGKTSLADELADVLGSRGRTTTRATIEDFLLPESVRYRRGEYSAEGCYSDNHDYEALNRVLLDPLGPAGDRRIQRAVYDRVRDCAVDPPAVTAAADAVLVFDGVFLQRPELVDRWELMIFVSVDADRAVERATIRERGTRTASDVERRWRERYLPSQQIYSSLVGPEERAEVLVVNDDLQRPRWTVRRR